MPPKKVAPASAEPITRHSGRPRRPDVEQLVLEAAIALLTERGIEGTTMSAVIERSGVARATVYLRWPNRQALITAAVRRAMGRPILTATGSVEADLRQGAERMRELLDSATFRNVFPALVAGLTRQGAGAEAPIPFAAVAPGAPVILDTYRSFAAVQGFRSEVSEQVVLDLIVGGQVGHLLSTGEGPTPDVRDQLMDVVFEGLRRRGPAEARQGLRSGPSRSPGPRT